MLPIYSLGYVAFYQGPFLFKKPAFPSLSQQL